jgi:hypothetical protein
VSRKPGGSSICSVTRLVGALAAADDPETKCEPPPDRRHYRNARDPTGLGGSRGRPRIHGRATL